MSMSSSIKNHPAEGELAPAGLVIQTISGINCNMIFNAQSHFGPSNSSVGGSMAPQTHDTKEGPDQEQELHDIEASGIPDPPPSPSPVVIKKDVEIAAAPGTASTGSSARADAGDADSSTSGSSVRAGAGEDSSTAAHQAATNASIAAGGDGSPEPTKSGAVRFSARLWERRQQEEAVECKKEDDQ